MKARRGSGTLLRFAGQVVNAEHLHTRARACMYVCRAGCSGDKTREGSTISWQQLPRRGVWNTDQRSSASVSENTYLNTNSCTWSLQRDHPLCVCVVMCNCVWFPDKHRHFRVSLTPICNLSTREQRWVSVSRFVENSLRCLPRKWNEPWI